MWFHLIASSAKLGWYQLKYFHRWARLIALCKQKPYCIKTKTEAIAVNRFYQQNTTSAWGAEEFYTPVPYHYRPKLSWKLPKILAWLTADQTVPWVGMTLAIIKNTARKLLTLFRGTYYRYFWVRLVQKQEQDQSVEKEQPLQTRGRNLMYNAWPTWPWMFDLHFTKVWLCFGRLYIPAADVIVTRMCIMNSTTLKYY